MNDLPIGGRPTGSGPMHNAGPGYPPDTDRSIPPRTDPRDHTSEARSLGGRADRRPVGFGSIIGFFVGLMFVFILAAAVAQFAVRGERQAPAAQAPPAPAVTQDQTPAKPSPPADGNPAANTTRDAVTP